MEAGPSGRITGGVEDASGAPLAGVTITLRGAADRDADTGPDGRFVFAGLPVGEYRLSAARDGFAPAARDLRVTAGETAYRRRSPDGYHPEWAWSFEGGVKTTLAGGRARLDVSAFQTDYEDLQVSVGAYVRNLTDEGYITGTFASPPPAIGGRPGEPRLMGVQVTFRR